jgi:hypothetical protein
MKTAIINKRFKVVSVSSNQNSFGLAGVILLALDGEAWEVGANHLDKPVKGAEIWASLTVNEAGERLGITWAGKSFEIPRQLPKAPQAVILEAWKV